MGYPSRQIAVSVKNKVATLRFNNPKRYNAWGNVMLEEIRQALDMAQRDKEVGAVVLTGTGKYYCSGVDFSQNMQVMKPSVLKRRIAEENAALFSTFINFPKPVVVAVNGPAIGACVTSSVLCDVVLASKEATFATPFAQLGIVPEGCSSYTFEKRMGLHNSERMLGAEGWVPTARDAKSAGLIDEVYETPEKLQEAAQERAEELVSTNFVRRTQADTTYANILNTINEAESAQLATAFLNYPFLMNQSRFWWKKNKKQLSVMFFALCLTRPLWIRL